MQMEGEAVQIEGRRLNERLGSNEDEAAQRGETAVPGEEEAVRDVEEIVPKEEEAVQSPSHKRAGRRRKRKADRPKAKAEL